MARGNTLNPSPYQLFSDALDQPSEERDAYLRRECGDDTVLLEEARSLLQAHESEGTILPRHVPAQPERIGRYLIREELGRGGMGVVYRAHDEELGRDVALKVLPRALARQSGWLERFRSEARHLASLNHVNIATLHTIEESGGTHFLTMEFIDGMTLADRLREGPLSEEEFRRVGSQIAGALALAHERSIVHRDIKPSNVKMRSDGTVKVLDFGLSMSLGTTIDTEPPAAEPEGVERAGTPGYQSPEQLRGESPTPSSDLFGLGVVFFECLTGSRMFPYSSRTQFGAALESGAHASAEELSRDLPDPWGELVSRLVSLDPARRPSAKEVLDRFQEVGTPSVAESPDSVVPATSDRSLRSVTTKVVALLLFAAGAFWLYSAGIFQGSPPTSSQGSANVTRTQLTHSGSDHRPRISPDGSWVAFNRFESSQRSQVMLQEVGSKNPKAIFEARALVALEWCPDSEGLLVTAGHGASKSRSTFWIRRDGTVVHDFGRPVLLSFSPDASEIAYCASRDDEIRFLDAQSLQPIPGRVVHAGEPVQSINWAPETDWILIETQGENQFYNLKSEERRALVRNEDADVVEWSSGQRVVCYRRSTNELTGMKLLTNGWSEPWPILSDVFCRDISVAHEADRIAYSRGPARSNVWVMDLPSGQSRQVTLNSLKEAGSRLHPDGSRIVFLRKVADRVDVISAPSVVGSDDEVTEVHVSGTRAMQMEWAGTSGGWFVASEVGSNRQIEWIPEQGQGLAGLYGPEPWLFLQDAVGTVCYFQTGDGAGLLAWDAESNDVEVIIPSTPTRRQWVARVSPDESAVAVLESAADGNDPGIFVYRGDDRQWIHGPTAAPIGWSEDGTTLYLIREPVTDLGSESESSTDVDSEGSKELRTEVVAMDLQTSAEVSLAFLPPSMHLWSSVDITADGRTLVFVVSDLYGDIWLAEGLNFGPS